MTSRLTTEIYKVILKGRGSVDDVMLFSGNSDTPAFALPYIDFATRRNGDFEGDERYITLKGWVYLRWLLSGA